jgi:hypothetical protein
MDKKEKANVYVGLGICSAALGFVKFAEPSSVRPTGRWSFIYGPLFDAFGQSGPAMAFVFIGAVFIGLGLFLRSKK